MPTDMNSVEDAVSIALNKKKSKIKYDINLDTVLDITVSKQRRRNCLAGHAYEIFKLCALSSVIIFTLGSFYLYEKHSQIRMNKLNDNIDEMIRRYNDLSKEITRKIPVEDEPFIPTEVYRNDDNSESNIPYFNEVTLPVTSQSIDYQNSVIETYSDVKLDNNVTLTRPENNTIDELNKSQYFTYKDLSTTKDKRVDISTLSSQKKPQSSRLRRDIGRGKRGKQNKRRPNRSRRRLAPLLATFVGMVPEKIVSNEVLIGPWVKSNMTNNSRFNFTKFHLVEDNMSIEVTTSGLYMISVQIYYYGDSKRCSYNVMLRSEGMSKGKQLVTCATATSDATGEISCYTSVITYLKRGDRLSLQQREMDRLINLREGYSHIQLLMLAPSKQT